MQCRAMEKAHVDVSCEDIDVSKGRVFYADSRVTVMQELPHIVATLPHPCKPFPCDRVQLIRLSTEPHVDGRVAAGGAVESEKRVHATTANGGC